LNKKLRPRLKKIVSCEGATPRHMSMSSKGGWLIVANQQSNKLCAFAVDPDSGELHFVSSSSNLPQPMCAIAIPSIGTSNLNNSVANQNSEEILEIRTPTIIDDTKSTLTEQVLPDN